MTIEHVAYLLVEIIPTGPLEFDLQPRGIFSSPEKLRAVYSPRYVPTGPERRRLRVFTYPVDRFPEQDELISAEPIDDFFSNNGLVNKNQLKLSLEENENKTKNNIVKFPDLPIPIDVEAEDDPFDHEV